MHGLLGESNFTKLINSIVKYTNSNTPVKDSLFEQASIYFSSAEQNKKTLSKLAANLEEAKQDYAQAGKISKSSLKEELKLVQRKYTLEFSRQQQLRIARRDGVLKVCMLLISAAEAESWEETQTVSAKVLGTLLLLLPRTDKKARQISQGIKPVYKAVLALRILDKLIRDSKTTYPFIIDRYSADDRYSQKTGELTLFQQEVCIPIVITALFQDIGLQHPHAQDLLKGQDGTEDEFRVLDPNTRVQLLKLNHMHTMDYIEHGIGAGEYVGNSKEDRDAYQKGQQATLKFIRSLLVDAIKPKLDVGNIIKIPQIYSSIVFSTKPNASYSDLPKASLVIEKAVETGSVNAVIAKHFVSIVGHFPQGYGITYIPKDNDGKWLDRYEYAIVIGLNPKQPHVPICRGATRHLTFNSSGQVFTIPKESNLHFAVARKKLSTVAPERLKEILEKLSSNFEERKNLDLLPHSWQPYDYFSYIKFQNLWRKS